MRFEFTISERLEASLSALFKRRSMTSLNIIGEVMNIPLPALECIWRKTGKKDIDPSSLCIDEESLELFAEAFIRKMKNYFEHSVRDFGILSSEERSDLLEFYNHFKIKENFVLTSKSTWSNISKDKLHEAFLNEVREKTEKYKIESYDGILDSFLSYISPESLESRVHHLYSTIGRNRNFNSDSNSNLLNRISHNSRYLSSHSNVTGNYNKHCVVNNRLRKILRAARFYIYAADDNSCDDIVKGSSEFIKHISFLKDKTIWTRKKITKSLITSKRATFQ